MTRIEPRWWWRTLASRPAKVAPVLAMAAAWALFLAGWIDVATLFASCVVAIVFGLLACALHLALVVRRALVQSSWRWVR